jgi:hypothetical protein
LRLSVAFVAREIPALDQILEYSSLLFLIRLTVDKATTFAGQRFVALGTDHSGIGLIDTQMTGILPGLKGLATSFADERLFAKAALDHDFTPKIQL